MSIRHAFTREQRSAVVTAILGFVLILVILQLYLFTATMNAHLGGDDEVVLPAAGASLVCFLLNLGLLRYVYRREHARR